MLHEITSTTAAPAKASVAARVGIEEQRRLYRVAIEERYRFFSYGDAMLIF